MSASTHARTSPAVVAARRFPAASLAFSHVEGQNGLTRRCLSMDPLDVLRSREHCAVAFRR